MMTKKENEKFIETTLITLNEIKEEARKRCVDVLKQLGGSIEWDWENEDAPSHISGLFQADLSDCYITKAYLDEADNIKVCLHAYYLDCEDYDDVLFSDEQNADYLDLLDHLNDWL